MKNENKADEMVDILSYLHQYVPMKVDTKIIIVPDTDSSETVLSEHLHHLLIVVIS